MTPPDREVNGVLECGLIVFAGGFLSAAVLFGLYLWVFRH